MRIGVQSHRGQGKNYVAAELTLAAHHGVAPFNICHSVTKYICSWCSFHGESQVAHVVGWVCLCAARRRGRAVGIFGAEVQSPASFLPSVTTHHIQGEYLPERERRVGSSEAQFVWRKVANDNRCGVVS